MDPILIIAAVLLGGGCCCWRTDVGPGMVFFLSFILLFVHPIIGVIGMVAASVVWVATRQSAVKIPQPIDPDSRLEIYKPALLALLALAPLLFGMVIGLTR